MGSAKWSFTCDRTQLSQSARTHGLGWRTAHASSIDEKGLIYIYISLRQLPPRLVRVLLVHFYLYTFIYVNECKFVYIIQTHTYIYIHINTHTHTHTIPYHTIHIHIYMYVYIYICLYNIYTYLFGGIHSCPTHPYVWGWHSFQEMECFTHLVG